MYYTDAISQYEYAYSLHQFYSLVTGLRERSDSVSRRFRSRLRRSSQIPAREDRRHTFPVSDFQEIDGSGRSAFLPTLSFGCVCVVVCGERTLTANAVRRSHRKRAQWAASGRASTGASTFEWMQCALWLHSSFTTDRFFPSCLSGHNQVT